MRARARWATTGALAVTLTAGGCGGDDGRAASGTDGEGELSAGSSAGSSASAGTASAGSGGSQGTTTTGGSASGGTTGTSTSAGTATSAGSTTSTSSGGGSTTDASVGSSGETTGGLVDMGGGTTASTSASTSTNGSGTSDGSTGTTGGSSGGTTGDPEGCPEPLVAAPAGMVLIPGGSFTSNAGGAQDVCTFAMDRSEVTVAQYAECVERGGCSDVGVTPSAACNYGVAGRTNHPMNCVEYDLAAEFCTWMGRRLPTEWEWQWAARGRDAGRTYPWGSAAPTCERWVWNEANAVGQGGCGTGTTAAVGSRSPAGDARDGLQDLAGNVAEWTSSQYEAGSSRQTVKGGSWDSGNVDGARASYRDDVLPTERGPGQGFRCVLDGTPSP